MDSILPTSLFSHCNPDQPLLTRKTGPGIPWVRSQHLRPPPPLEPDFFPASAQLYPSRPRTPTWPYRKPGHTMWVRSRPLRPSRSMSASTSATARPARQGVLVGAKLIHHILSLLPCLLLSSVSRTDHNNRVCVIQPDQPLLTKSHLVIQKPRTCAAIEHWPRWSARRCFTAQPTKEHKSRVL